jgi:hypothetical protein
MQAHTIHFERGIDPKASMGIGQIGSLHPGTLLKCIERISPKVNDYNYKNFYIEKGHYSVIKKIKATHNQIELELATYDKFPKHFKKVDLQFIGGEYLTVTPTEFFEHFEVVEDVDESVNFERGLEPKRAMKVGQHRNDLFNEIQSMSFIDAMKSFPELGSDNDKRILSLAANMLGVPEKEVRCTNL